MSQCVITGRLTSVTERPLALATIGIRLDQAPNDVQFLNGNALTRTEHLETTDEFGNFSVALTQGVKIVIRIEDLGLHRQVTVPSQASATLEELLNGDI